MFLGRRKYEWRELPEPLVRDLAQVHCARKLKWRSESEVRGHGRLERRLRAASVGGSSRCH